VTSTSGPNQDGCIWEGKAPERVILIFPKRQAAPDEGRLIAPITFHDLRHDFAHRALEAGWTLEEVAYYLGQITTKGLPATQTAIRYTQTTRAQVKEKLKLLKS
jgi:integrase